MLCRVSRSANQLRECASLAFSYRSFADAPARNSRRGRRRGGPPRGSDRRKSREATSQSHVPAAKDSDPNWSKHGPRESLKYLSSRNERVQRMKQDIERLSDISPDLPSMRRQLDSVLASADEEETKQLDFDADHVYDALGAYYREQPEREQFSPEYHWELLNKHLDEFDEREVAADSAGVRLAPLISDHDQSRTDQAVTFKAMMQAGCHYGARVGQLNTWMSQFIFGARDGQHIFDLSKSISGLRRVMFILQDLVKDGGRILFVGNSPVASEIVGTLAKKCGCGYQVGQYKQGTLANWNVMASAERGSKSFPISKYSEADLFRQLRDFSVFRSLDGIPDFIVLLNRKGNDHLISEAKNLRIPVACLCDSDTSPKDVMYVIPGNDDSPYSVFFFMDLMSRAVLEVKEQIALRRKLVESKPEEEEKETDTEVRRRVRKNRGLTREDMADPLSWQKPKPSRSLPPIVRLDKSFQDSLEGKSPTEILDRVSQALLEGEELISDNGDLSALCKQPPTSMQASMQPLLRGYVQNYVDHLFEEKSRDVLLVSPESLQNRLRSMFPQTFDRVVDELVPTPPAPEGTRRGRFAGWNTNEDRFFVNPEVSKPGVADAPLPMHRAHLDSSSLSLVEPGLPVLFPEDFKASSAAHGCVFVDEASLQRQSRVNEILKEQLKKSTLSFVQRKVELVQTPLQLSNFS